MSIRVFLADDHAIFRGGLRALLQTERDIEIVGDCGNSDDLIRSLQQCPTDVLLLDISMPGLLTGPPLAEEILRVFPKLRIVVLTAHEDPYYLREMIRVGVRGYVIKRSSADDVLHAIRAAHRGEFHVDTSLAGEAMSALVSPHPEQKNAENRVSVLTQRELDVCRLLALGHTNAEAGQKLSISERTIESHRTNIMAKLGLKNRAELVRFALDNDLIQ